jgi:hypothetical protein
MKICFKCKKEKPLCEYYKHNQMADGHVNKCKDCNKLDVKKDYYRKSDSIEFIEKERKRGREKYHRLNYKNRSKELNKNKAWKNTTIYKGLHKKFKTPKGFELHHWNYNNDFLEDILVMKIKEHRQAHVNLIFDNENLIFKTLDNISLDTKEKHIEYLISKNIKF